MATILSNGVVGEKPPAVGLTTAEQDIVISCPNHPKGWIVTVIADEDWLYHSEAGGTATDGMPFKAYQSLTIAIRDAKTFTFRARVGGGTASLHALVLQ